MLAAPCFSTCYFHTLVTHYFHTLKLTSSILYQSPHTRCGCAVRMERATAREAELGGPLPHLAELGVDEADLRAYGAGNDARTHNTVLQAAKTHHTSTAQVAMPSDWQPCTIAALGERAFP